MTMRIVRGCGAGRAVVSASAAALVAGVLLVAVGGPLACEAARNTTLLRHCDELYAGWRPIRSDALGVLLPHQQFIYLQNGQRVPAKEPDVIHPAVADKKAAAGRKPSTPAPTTTTTATKAPTVTKAPTGAPKTPDDGAATPDMAKMPRMFDNSDFEDNFDNFPDERFGQAGRFAPAPGSERHITPAEQQQQRQQSPAQTTQAQQSSLRNLSQQPDSARFARMPQEAKDDLDPNEPVPDVPSPELAEFVNSIADWSTDDPDADTSVIDLLVERGLKLVPVSEQNWTDTTDMHRYYRADHTDLHPFVVRDSPMKEWSMLSWTMDEWKENVPYLYSLSVSSHRRLHYFTMDSPMAMVGIEAWDAPGVPNKRVKADFEKQQGLPVSVLPYFRPPQGVVPWPSMSQVLDSVDSDKYMYGFMNIKRRRYEKIKHAIPHADDLLYYDSDKNMHSLAIWVNTNGAIAPFHYDSSNIWHGMMYGRKRFYYLRPEDVFNLYLQPPMHPAARNSMVCLSCPTTREKAEAELQRYPNYLDIKEMLYADIGPGDFVTMPAFWPHEVQCLDRLCFSMSSGRNAPELAGFEDPNISIAGLLDDVWSMDLRQQMLHTQAFFIAVTHRIFKDTPIPGCTQESTCLKTIARRIVYSYYEHLGVFEHVDMVNMPCPPLKLALRKMKQESERAKIMAVIGSHVDRVARAWDEHFFVGGSRYGHFARWMGDQLQLRLKWFEVPLFYYHCLL